MEVWNRVDFPLRAPKHEAGCATPRFPRRDQPGGPDWTRRLPVSRTCRLGRRKNTAGRGPFVANRKSFRLVRSHSGDPCWPLVAGANRAPSQLTLDQFLATCQAYRALSKPVSQNGAESFLSTKPLVPRFGLWYLELG